ncbi:MAG: hypothetical protein UR93_C0013G0002 [Berkelbacteria bacterium GW2011_GWA2_35_9]|uniref:AAA+ ATPase domain-containing protein n=1 Tax=Berkelbacteria bacterium GW2011_GWA2_35_9 TaxID=1618333 RepID=A0A0G0G9Q1_9BACT|nr:MAG: hypothetical protein UR93_C0013G0002 [Berkelbacteria bacterium GW2011_GWA2_35_9]
MHIKRQYDDLDKYLKRGKALVVYGPRRVGKTTLLKRYLSTIKIKYKLDSGDNIQTQHLLGSHDFKQIFSYLGDNQLIAIDEAQKVPNIGMALKIIVDQKPEIVTIATGSSSFDLSNQIGEPLTGRKKMIVLYPVSQMELKSDLSEYELKQNIEDYLLYGSYPEVLTAINKEEKIETLQDLVNSYLLKDILTLDKIKGSKKIFDLLKLLALQIGNEVSLSELANNLDIDIKTVGRYIDLLEKTFVIVRAGALSRNLRSEIVHKQKYYFVDTGVRNAIINQFNTLDSRNDVGALWENFIVIERLKKRTYQNIYGNWYFWRTYSQQEIDLIEERDGKLFGFECKWSVKKEVKPPKEWQKTYSGAEFTVITPDNYLEFIV